MEQDDLKNARGYDKFFLSSVTALADGWYDEVARNYTEAEIARNLFRAISQSSLVELRVLCARSLPMISQFDGVLAADLARDLKTDVAAIVQQSAEVGLGVIAIADMVELRAGERGSYLRNSDSL